MVSGHVTARLAPDCTLEGAHRRPYAFRHEVIEKKWQHLLCESVRAQHHLEHRLS